MKVGIDSYCYHRFFGEVYSQQRQPARRMTLEDFIDRAENPRINSRLACQCVVHNGLQLTVSIPPQNFLGH